MIDIVYIENKFPLPTELIGFVETFIGTKEKERALRFRRWQDKQANLLGKLLLAHLLKQYGYSKQILRNLDYSEFNRPYIKQAKLDFNISHSGEFVVCALSDTQLIGIDIELIQQINLEDFSYILNSRDQVRINDSADKYFSFFQIWSAKEAMLKADGRGLVNELDKLEINGDLGIFEKTIYHLKELKIDPLYSSFIASATPIENVRIQRLSNEDLFEYL
jgi:4'-phosphopantetheinyl transferase